MFLLNQLFTEYSSRGIVCLHLFRSIAERDDMCFDFPDRWLQLFDFPTESELVFIELLRVDKSYHGFHDSDRVVLTFRLTSAEIEWKARLFLKLCMGSYQVEKLVYGC